MNNVQMQGLLLLLVSNGYVHHKTTFGLISTLVIFAIFIYTYSTQDKEND